MSIEKTIRTQARAALRGNWIAIVTALFLRLGALLLSYFLFYSLCLPIGVFDSEGALNQDKSLFLVIILFITAFSIFLLSPFKNGFYRICTLIAGNNKAELADAFYFFKGIKQYVNALMFNILITFRRMIYIILGLAPLFLLVLISAFFPAAFKSSTGANEVFDILRITLTVLGVVFGLFISAKLYAYEFLFAAEDSADIMNIYARAKQITRGRGADYIRLMFTFAGWILLTVTLVIPGMYTLPYISTSFAMSTKWLNNLDKEGKMV